MKRNFKTFERASGLGASFHDNLRKSKVYMLNLLSMCPGWKTKVPLVREYDVPPSQVRHEGADVAVRSLRERLFRATSREMRDVPASPLRKKNNKRSAPATPRRPKKKVLEMSPEIVATRRQATKRTERAHKCIGRAHSE